VKMVFKYLAVTPHHCLVYSVIDSVDKSLDI